MRDVVPRGVNLVRVFTLRFDTVAAFWLSRVPQRSKQ